MAAGLGFKTFAVGEVLTAADTNGYLMQGVLVFASAAARDAAITSPQEGQFAYLKDTNVTTYYTGSAWTNLDTTGMVNPMTTTGDTIYSSSGSTPARLGIGSTGQVLTVSGGVPSWATPSSGGGMTLLSTTTLSGSSTTISSISGSYKNLLLIINGVNCSANNQWYLRTNGTFGGWYEIYGEVDGNAWIQNNGNDLYLGAGSIKASDANNSFAVMIYNYASTTAYKPFHATGSYVLSNSAVRNHFDAGSWRDTTAITSFDINTGSGTFNGGTVLTYGVS